MNFVNVMSGLYTCFSYEMVANVNVCWFKEHLLYVHNVSATLLWATVLQERIIIQFCSSRNQLLLGERGVLAQFIRHI